VEALEARTVPSFAAAVDFGVGGNPAAVAVGDFNSDGRRDLVTANTGANSVSVLLGNGDGTFQATVGYTVGSAPSSVTVGDFDGDGALDVAAANGLGGSVSVLPGVGDGTFQTALTFAVGPGLTSVTAGDFNTDGQLDLATASATGTVSVLLGNGTGTFQTGGVSFVGTLPASVTAGDFNRDGRLDLATANPLANQVSVLLGNGDGTFQTAVNHAAGPGSASVTVGDFNRDGRLDLATANGLGNSVSVLLGLGDGSFQAAVSYAAGLGPASVTAGDFNGDGKLDLAAAEGLGNGVSVLLGLGNGTLLAPLHFAAGALTAAVTAGDFNNDGKLDLAAANSGSSSVSVLLNLSTASSTGTFPGVLPFGTGLGPIAVAVGDFNRDGTPDVAVANSAGNDVSVLLGNGDGSFQPAVNYATGTLPAAVAVGDFNGDGAPDLVAANTLTSTVSVLLGNGDGTFQAKVDYTVGTDPVTVAVADFNRDGRSDVVTVNSSSDDVSVLLGNGDGTFQTAAKYAVGALPVAVAVADFDGDGTPDLAVVNGAASSVSVLLGNGDGTFQTSVNFSAGYGPQAVAVGDFNGDGRPDLAVANVLSNDVTVLENTRAGGAFTFASPVSFSAGYGPLSVAVGDFNGDGRPDLATANSSLGSVKVILNTSAGAVISFGPVTSYDTSTDHAAVAVGDFNGDGTPDLVAARGLSDEISVLLGGKNALTQFGVNAPAVAVAGTPVTITVTALDANSVRDSLFNLTVHFTSSDGAALLPADYTFQLSDFGTRTFTVVLRTAGVQTITVTSTLGSFTGSTSVIVSPAAASSLVLTGPTMPGTAGTPRTFTVAALDPFGNVATGYMGTVRFTSTDGQALLPADFTFTDVERGVYTFSTTLKTVGLQALTVSDTTTPALTATQPGLVVLPAAASSFTVTGLASPRPAGSSGSFTVVARDAFGNVAIDYTGTVTFTSSDGQAVLPGAYTFKTGDKGTRSFSATLNTAGVQSLLVADAGNAALAGDLTVTVTPVLTLDGPRLAVAGMPYILSLATTDLGTDNVLRVTVDWGDGTVETFAGLPEAVAHVYADRPKGYRVTATAVAASGPLSAVNRVPVVVLVPEVLDQVSDQLDPGEVFTLSVGGIAATAALSPEDLDGLTLFLALYSDNPEEIDVDGLVFYDLLVTGAEAGDTVTATFRFPAGALNPTLLFFNEDVSAYQPVLGSQLAPASLTVDRLQSVIRVVFDRTSFPAITDLDGTVFTIAIPSPAPTSTALSPALALADASGRRVASDAPPLSSMVRTTTFVSTNQLTLALTASQDSQLISSRTILAGGGEDESPSARNDADQALWLRLLMEFLDDVPQWLQQFGSAAELRQWLRQERAAPETAEPAVEEATPEAGAQARPADVIGAVFADVLPVELMPTGDLPLVGGPAAGPVQPAADPVDAAERADWRWALATGLAVVACRPVRPVRPGERRSLGVVQE
jgi:hypothetical protein